MRTNLRKLGVAALAAVSIATAAAATTGSADARPFHGGWHGGWHHHRGFGFGPAFAGALAFGAIAGAPYYWGPRYYDDCVPHRRVVGYTPWGRPIVRVVSACY